MTLSSRRQGGGCIDTERGLQVCDYTVILSEPCPADRPSQGSQPINRRLYFLVWRFYGILMANTRPVHFYILTYWSVGCSYGMPEWPRGLAFLFHTLMLSFFFPRRGSCAEITSIFPQLFSVRERAVNGFTTIPRVNMVYEQARAAGVWSSAVLFFFFKASYSSSASLRSRAQIGSDFTARSMARSPCLCKKGRCISWNYQLYYNRSTRS